MKLETYLRQQDAKQLESIREVWSRIETALEEAGLSFVKENLLAEVHLPEEVWQRLLVASSDVEGENKITETLTCVFNDSTQCGPEISDTPKPKGRVIDRGRFIDWLKNKANFASPEAQRQYLADIRSNQSLFISHQERLQNVPLGKHLIWSTFQEGGGDPFEVYTSSEDARARLGLMKPAKPEDKELFLLVYVIPDDVTIRYPTVADAYAGKGWNCYFQCSNSGDDWGYTIGGHPEVVHEVIKGSCLIESEYPFLAIRVLR